MGRPPDRRHPRRPRPVGRLANRPPPTARTGDRRERPAGALRFVSYASAGHLEHPGLRTHVRYGDSTACSRLCQAGIGGRARWGPEQTGSGGSRITRGGCEWGAPHLDLLPVGEEVGPSPNRPSDAPGGACLSQSLPGGEVWGRLQRGRVGRGGSQRGAVRESGRVATRPYGRGRIPAGAGNDGGRGFWASMSRGGCEAAPHLNLLPGGRRGKTSPHRPSDAPGGRVPSLSPPPEGERFGGWLPKGRVGGAAPRGGRSGESGRVATRPYGRSGREKR